MEGLLSRLKQTSTAAVATIVTILAIIPVVMSVLFAIFAFNNPDRAAWYGISANDTDKLFPDEEAARNAGVKDLTDIHQRIVNWFLFGFILAVGPICVALISLLAVAIHVSLGLILCNLGTCLLGCS